LNILHVVRTPTSVECFLLDFLKAQKAQGHNVAVACNVEEDASVIKANGIEVCPYEIARSMSISNIVRAFRSLSRVITDTRYDLIMAHMPLAGGITRIIAKIYSRRSKVIYVSHGFACAPYQFFIRWLYLFIAEWVLGKMTDAVFVMNSRDYKMARKTRILSRVEMIRQIPGMGVDLERFAPLQNEHRRFSWESCGIEKGRKVILFAGRMITEKGIFDLLEATRLLRNRNYAFVLAGDGPMYKAACKYVKSHDLVNQVFLLGWRNRDEMEDYMRHCDVFVLPTYYWEGLPVTILEAMASAKPVIATRQRGCEDEVIDGMTGFLVEIKKPRQLAERIDFLLNNDELACKMGKAGRCRVEQYFSKEQAVRAFCEAIAAVGSLWGMGTGCRENVVK
jgi:glycosyltransferase involved in cell wall biosynthesis